MQIRPFRMEDEAAVVALWGACELTRPWNDPFKDIQRKTAVQPERFLVGEVDGRIVASVMAGYDGHRGWLYYLAVDPSCRRKGYGRAIVQAAERMLQEAGCPKINLQVRTSNREVIAFYECIGFAVDEVVGMGKRLIPDD